MQTSRGLPTRGACGTRARHGRGRRNPPVALGWLNGDSPLASPAPLDGFYNVCAHPSGPSA